MGSMVEASCECGYEGTFPIGGGMATFQEECSFPCLCRQCKRVVDANLLTKLACPTCRSDNITPYDQPELCEQQGSNVVASWSFGGQNGRELQLTDGLYFCPLCDTYRLRFFEGDVCWD